MKKMFTAEETVNKAMENFDFTEVEVKHVTMIEVFYETFSGIEIDNPELAEVYWIYFKLNLLKRGLISSTQFHNWEAYSE